MYKTLILVSALFVLSACGALGSKQEKQPEKEVLCGGYTAQRSLTDEELLLFKKVTQGLDGVNYTPQSVATQIVAGTNYRFVCKAVTTTPESPNFDAAVVVYQPLPGQGEARITEITRL